VATGNYRTDDVRGIQLRYKLLDILFEVRRNMAKDKLVTDEYLRVSHALAIIRQRVFLVT